jgi:hypothetical protein
MLVHPALFRILIRATKSLAKRAFAVPSALVAVPATVNVFSNVAILCCLSKLPIKLIYDTFTATTITIILDIGVNVNHNSYIGLTKINDFDLKLL